MNNDCRIPAARNEPPQPQRGLTREERGRNVGDAQAEAADGAGHGHHGQADR